MMATEREELVQPTPVSGERAVAPRRGRLPASTIARLRCTRARTVLWTSVAAALLVKAALTLWSALAG